MIDPNQLLIDTLNELRDGLTRQEQIVDDVAALRTQHKWLLAILTVALIALGGVGASAVMAFQAGTDAERAVAQVRDVVVMQQQDRDSVALSTCRVRNDVARQTRDLFNAAFDSLNDMNPEDRDDIEMLRQSIPSAEQADRDCNGDGALDSLDYPM